MYIYRRYRIAVDRNVIGMWATFRSKCGSQQLYLKVRALIPIYNVFLILFFTPLSKNESRIFILSGRNLYCPKVPLCFFCKQANYYTNLVITTSYKEKLIYIFGSHRTSHVIAHTGSKIYWHISIFDCIWELTTHQSQLILTYHRRAVLRVT